MNKKPLPEPRELKILLISSPDKNKPNKYLMLLKLSFQNLKLLLHTPLLKPSWNLPNLDLPTQLPLLLKLLLPSTLKLLPDASTSLKNYKLISPFSLMTILKTKSKLKLISITSWSKLLPWEKPPKLNSPLTEYPLLKLKLPLKTNKEDSKKTNKNLNQPPLVSTLKLMNVMLMMPLTTETPTKEMLNSIS